MYVCVPLRTKCQAYIFSVKETAVPCCVLGVWISRLDDDIFAFAAIHFDKLFSGFFSSDSVEEIYQAFVC